MPSNWLSIDTNFPTFTDRESTAEKLESVQSYLYMLVEQLRYTLHNLDMTNMNQTAMTQFKGSITEPIMGRIEDAEQGLTNQMEVTAEALRARLSNAEGDIASLSATASGLGVRLSNAEGDLTSLAATAAGIASDVSAIDGRVSSLRQTVDGFTLSVSNGTTSSTIQLKSGSTVIASKEIKMSGLVTFTDLSGGTTTINGACLQTGTVTASTLQGGTVKLLTGAGRSAGGLSITGASSADYAIELSSNGALRLTAYPGDVWLENGGNVTFGLVTSPLYGISCGRTVFPQVGGRYYLGTEGYTWAAVYADTGEIVTSDREKKNSIEYAPQEWETFFDGLAPARFKYNDGSSGRFHAGFIAQDVERAMEQAGMASTDFAGFVKSPREDGYDYALRYEEFIALNTWQLQKLKRRVEALEAAAGKEENKGWSS